MPALTQLLLVFLLLLLSLADLKYRVAPAVEIFFFGSVLVAATYSNAYQNLFYVGVVVLSVAYGALLLPSGFALPLLLVPSSWPTLLIGYGVKKELMGRGDLFAIGGISVLFPLDVVIVTLIGTVLWTRWWSKRHTKKPNETNLIPLLPGMALGTIVGIGVHLLLQTYLTVFV